MAAEANVLKLNEATHLLDKAKRSRRLILAAAGGLLAVIALGAFLATSALMQARDAMQRAVVEANFALRSQLLASEAQLRAERDALALQRSFPIKAIGLDTAISQEGWLIKDGRPMRQIADGPIYIAAFGPDKSKFAVATGRGIFVGTTTDPGEALRIPADGPATSISFSPSGQSIVIAGYDGTVRLWDVATGRPIGAPIAVLRTSDAGATAATFSPDGGIVAVGTHDGKVTLWDAATGGPIGPTITLGSAVSSVAFSDDARSLLVGASGAVWVFDRDTAHLIARFPG